jgi:hypothetical protein
MASPRISVFESRELQGVILALKGMDKDIAKQIRQQTKAVVSKVWEDSVAANISTRLESRAFGNTARVAVSNQNITLSVASVGKPLSGGLNPRSKAHVVEFGADRSTVVSYEARSARGTNYTVNQRRTRAMLREKNKKGYVFYPTVREVIPRIASLWIQTTVRAFHEAIEKR